MAGGDPSPSGGEVDEPPAPRPAVSSYELPDRGFEKQEGRAGVLASLRFSQPNPSPGLWHAMPAPGPQRGLFPPGEPVVP